MKLKYLIPSFIAALTLFVSCSDDNDPTYLDEVQLSSSYVAIPQEGGSTAVKVTATGEWAIDAEKIPAWLTISPTSGVAGETTMTFSADAAIDGRTCELLLTCGGKTQHINVIQGLSTVSNATCAEVIAGPDSKTYRVTGVVTKIVNTVYGNWYLDDGTGEIYIYGTLDKSGKNGQNNSIAAWGIEVGDEITVEGPKTTYNGTIELVDVAVVKLNKSLIKVAEIDPEDGVMPVEGGDFTVTLSNKGQGMYVTVPEDAASWLSIASISGNVVNFRVAPNEGGDRSTNIVFKTTDGKKEYTCEQALSQKGSIIAATVAEFLAAPVGDTQYRLTGVIKKVARADYGNVYIADYTGEVYVYGIGAKGDFEKLGLKEGDVVTLVGKRGAHNDNPQMAGAQYESHISVTEISIADFLDKPVANNVYYMVSGEILDIANASYGNMTIKDETGEVYVYGCYPGWGATGDFRKGLVDKLGLEPGDKVTIIGTRASYTDKNTNETTQQVGNGVYFSHEKKGE